MSVVVADQRVVETKRGLAQEHVAALLPTLPGDDLGLVGIIDETGVRKAGTKTPGVQRQWCGSVGKQENSIVTVHLGYVVGDFHCLLDGDLFLPESWSRDRQRCRDRGGRRWRRHRRPAARCSG